MRTHHLAEVTHTDPSWELWVVQEQCSSHGVQVCQAKSPAGHKGLRPNGRKITLAQKEDDETREKDFLCIFPIPMPSRLMV